MNGAEVVAEILKREGTEFIACYPRNAVIEAGAAIDIRPVISRQERVGVGIADGFSRVRHGRQNGVFAAQRGPGIENAFPGIAQAYSENVPMMIIAGGSPLDRHYIRPTFRATDVCRPVTKWAALAHTTRELPDLMRRAYHNMRSGGGGTVLVEIPVDVSDAPFEGPLDYTPVLMLRAAPDPDDIKKAVRMLLAAKTPVLWAGQGIHYAEAGERLAALAELIPAPVLATNPGKSAIPDNHPLSLGASAVSQPKMLTDYLKGADLVVAIGSSLTKTTWGPAVPRGKKIIHATANVGDINKDYRADLGIVGDAALVIEALIEEVGRQKGGSDSNALADLKDAIAGAKKAWLADWAKHFSSDEVPINQYRVIGELMKVVDCDDVIITHDSGSPREQLLPFWETTKSSSYLGWGKSTQLGYGLGITMGAKLAAPEKLCINFMGDSSIGMTGMDLETAARNRIGILTVVFNNQVMAAERHVMQTSIRKYNTLEVGGNYTKLADALNVDSMKVEKPADISTALKKGIDATEQGRPFLVEIIAKEGYDFSRYS